MAKQVRKSGKPPVKRDPEPGAPGDEQAEEEAFTRSLIENKQAARALPDGTLPPGATHELVEDAQGRVKAVRRRFSAL